MDTIQITILICILAALAVVSMCYAASTAQEIEEEKPSPKIEAGKVTYSHCTAETEKPKKKRRKYYKKKKPAIANTATTEKRPVGRPKKSK